MTAKASKKVVEAPVELNLLVGADPEVFFRHKTSGVFIRPYSIPGDKSAPFLVKDGAVQMDGMAMEFNITPAANENDFVNNLNSVYSQLCNMANNGDYPGYEPCIVPFAKFTDNYLAGIESRLIALGCLPDWDAWDETENPPPGEGKKPFEVTTRTAAGHIHVGWDKGIDVTDKNHRSDCFAVAKQLDYYIGLPSLLWDNDKTRRELYGKAGALRFKDYGMEYRTPSNMWLRHDDLKRFVFRNTVKAVKDLKKGKSAVVRYGDLARQMINQNIVPNDNFMTEFYPDLPIDVIRNLNKAA